ncbi:MAG: bifunctional riboflavin kinase/FAD synthetase [Candidatus Eisenbacteria bacterium]|uniref:Riboflavin biosynthesis protein n=1 Tax=Eiseniibacteriota bacterium TaxID=2212470 RepID=A0A538U5M9_UNCEI|nr:MAG: bifunctional riboflavin kinase/FAD synthetase [Candidatus Eisenbacteria bacterium]
MSGPGSVLAVGVFDGLHLGHRELLGRALAIARERASRCVVVSFDPHPDVVLSHSFQAIAPLTPIPEKRERLLALGIDQLEVLPFTRELASLAPEAFVDRNLMPLHPRALIVGADFALGHRRTGDVARLREIGAGRGFDVHAVPLLELDHAPVTSTRIRGQLERGRVAEARRLLGRGYDLSGLVVAGNGIGRALGCPTANLRLHDEKLVPGHGIYAVWARIGAETLRRPAAMSIGVRPTFGGQERALEVHLLDWSGELVGRDLAVEFADWLRPQVRFENAEALKRAMEDDLARIRQRLAAGTAAA